MAAPPPTKTLKAGQTLPQQPTASPLYRRIQVVDGSTTITKYLIAYRAVTVFPLQIDPKVDPTRPPIDVPQEPYPGTVGLPFSEGALETDKIEIHAEDIYLYQGSRLPFPGKKLTLTANRIFAVQNPPSPDCLDVHIDCSGIDRPMPDPHGAPGRPGGSGNATWNVYPNATFTFDKPQAAQPGPAGADGSKGGDGGVIRIVGMLQSDPASTQKTSPSLWLDVAPGKGGRGQNGFDGGGGGSTWCPNYGDYLSDCYMYSQVDRKRTWKDFNIMPEVQGGTGGNGGAAGSPGSGGQVFALLKPADNFKPLYKKDGVEGRIQVAGGSPGHGGLRGKVSADWNGARNYLDYHGIPHPTLHQFGTINGGEIDMTDIVPAPDGLPGASIDVDIVVNVSTDGTLGASEIPCTTKGASAPYVDRKSMSSVRRQQNLHDGSSLRC